MTPPRSVFRAIALLFVLPACSALLDDGFQPRSDGGPLTDAPSPDAEVDTVVWVQVAAGEDHACGLRSDGSLWCWGDYESGQLGHGVDGADLEDGETAVQATPVRVLSAAHDEEHDAWDDWTDVALGMSHSCGIRDDGTLWCWGDGTSGELGHHERDVSPLPVLVRADEDSGELFWDDWVEVSLGRDHTCGRREDDTLWCWGRRRTTSDEYANALGDGHEPLDVRTTPTQVLQELGLNAWDDWVEVAVHEYHSCGRRREGTLWCWGPNDIRGRLGTGNDEPTTTPRQVVADDGGDGWDDWVQVSATAHGGCGRRRNRTAWCWGSGWFGVRGDGDTEPSATPTQVLAANAEPGGEAWDDWIDIQGGWEHVCGRLEDDSLWCWGLGSDGRLGDGFTQERSTPSRVLRAGEGGDGEGWDDWVQVAPGGTVTCGLRAEGSLWCWGAGEHGQRGDGDPDTATRETPIRVLDPSP